MSKYLIYWNKGLIIGLFTGLLKIMYAIRNENFKWKLALTDLLGAMIVGYSVWALSAEYMQNTSWQIYLLVIVMSLNSFIVLGFLMNPDLLKTYFKVFFHQQKDIDHAKRGNDSGPEEIPSSKKISNS